MIVAMVCTLLATMILGAMLKLAMVHRRQMRAEQQSVQADWLAISGVERAVSRLSEDRNYRGELWEIEPEELGGVRAGQTEIRVTPSTAIPDGFTITVIATYPSRSRYPIRRTKTVSIELGSRL